MPELNRMAILLWKFFQDADKLRLEVSWTPVFICVQIFPVNSKEGQQ